MTRPNRQSDQGWGMISRRLWLAEAWGWSLGLLLLGNKTLLGNDGEKTEAREIEAIEEQAVKVGLAEFKTTRTEHYLAIGNAPEAFRSDALAICELMNQDFLKHFRGKGFDLKDPKARLTVVALANASSFQAFTDEDPKGVIGGFYDRDANRLIFYDFRNPTGAGIAKPQAANTMALVHEATHQLTFNTGMLDREGDVPACVAEGLATYCEQRPPRKHTDPGKLNVERFKVLTQARGKPNGWIPIETLIAGDDSIDKPADADALQVAYAESWLLVHMLLKNPDRLPGFRDYLAAIRPRRDDKERLADATEHLGDLKKLDRALKAYRPR